MTHLETELSSLRTELSHLYRSQAAAQNKQLSLSDALRDRDEEVRGLREELRTLREFQEAALKREREWEGRYESRGRDLEVCLFYTLQLHRISCCGHVRFSITDLPLAVLIKDIVHSTYTRLTRQTLNDELLSLNLELTSTLTRNAALKSDNAQLVQRWIDKMQENVDSMNVAFDAEQRGHERRTKDRVDGEEWVALSTGTATAPASEAGVGGNGGGVRDGTGGGVGDVGDVGEALADAVEDQASPEPGTGLPSDAETGEGGPFDESPASEPYEAHEADGGETAPVDMSASTILPPEPRPSTATSSSGPTASKRGPNNTSISASVSLASGSRPGGGTARTSSTGQGPGPFAFAQRSTSTSSSPGTSHTTTPATASGSASRSTVNARRKMFEKPEAGQSTAGAQSAGGVKQQQQQDFRAGGKA